jgi:hypothetical protein
VVNLTLSNIPSCLSHWRTPHASQKVEEESFI